MTSTVTVSAKTINDRDVISIRKEYSGEEHEVMCPIEDGIQLLFNIMSVVNDGKTEDDRLVLVRKGDVGRLDESEQVSDPNQSRKQILAEVTKALFDDQTTADVMTVVEGDTNE